MRWRGTIETTPFYCTVLGTDLILVGEDERVGIYDLCEALENLREETYFGQVGFFTKIFFTVDQAYATFKM